ncbi:MAG TPA: DUF4340 domain-containing protein [candidate division WOR-3 bacterium]|uniref:DUF4340 domain-containing protein n=1 Tax=candidate division WOR-3 bacterium TaxID=2052148 RepID=A0A7C0XA68_UNCW3|nr:DUF4340 domain-containing protein [candidate division WOR-3 bacterium]
MRGTVKLLIILVILALLAFLVERSRTRKLSPHLRRLISEKQTEKIDRIIISREGDTSRLIRENDTWYVEILGKKKKTDEKKVDRLFGTLDSLRGELVSSSGERYGEYEVDEKGLRALFLSGDDTVLDIIVGKSGPDFNSSYVRKTDEEGVYLVNRYLRSVFYPNPDRWRDRKIVEFDRDSIEEFSVRKGKKYCRVVREDTLYVVKEGDCDTSKIRSFLGTWSRLTAVSFDDTISVAAAGLDKPQYIVTLVPVKGEEVKLTVGKKDDKNRYYLSKEGDEQIYIIAPYTVNRLKDLLREKSKKRKK